MHESNGVSPGSMGSAQCRADIEISTCRMSAAAPRAPQRRHERESRDEIGDEGQLIGSEIGEGSLTESLIGTHRREHTRIVVALALGLGPRCRTRASRSIR